MRVGGLNNWEEFQFKSRTLFCCAHQKQGKQEDFGNSETGKDEFWKLMGSTWRTLRKWRDYNRRRNQRMRVGGRLTKRSILNRRRPSRHALGERFIKSNE